MSQPIEKEPWEEEEIHWPLLGAHSLFDEKTALPGNKELGC